MFKVKSGWFSLRWSNCPGVPTVTLPSMWTWTHGRWTARAAAGGSREFYYWVNSSYVYACWSYYACFDVYIYTHIIMCVCVFVDWRLKDVAGSAWTYPCVHHYISRAAGLKPLFSPSLSYIGRCCWSDNPKCRKSGISLFLRNVPLDINGIYIYH